MKTSTPFFTFLLTFFCTALLASPNRPAFSEFDDYEAGSEWGIHGSADSMANRSRTLPDTTASCFAESVLWPTIVVTPDLCSGGTGDIDITPDPLTSGPWFYMWSNGETTQDLTDVPSGLYMVTIFSVGDGIVQAETIFVPDNPAPFPISLTGFATGNTLCNGTSNGAVTISPMPNPSIFTYLWSNGATTQNLVNVPPGDYTVTMTYAGPSCTVVEDFTVPNLTNFPAIPQSVFIDDICEQANGSAAVVPSGGQPPYSYEWSNGGTTSMINNLSPGTYTVTVTGANGCTNSLSGMVTAVDLPVSVDEISVVSNTTCIGANGSVTIIVEPPAAALTATFLWSNGATTQNLTNVPSGSYRVTVTRAGTCTASAVWYVEHEPIEPEIEFTNTSATCGLSNGGVNLTVLPGGVAPYTYLWSGGQTTQDLSNQPPGNYVVTITSANGCTVTGNATVDDTPAVFSYSGLVTDQTSCDTTNGRIVLSLFPNNLAYQWSNGATTTVLNNLAPGDYTVTVSAGGTCTEVETFTVGDVTEYPVIPITPTATTCGLANGSADLNVTAGLMPFTYLWSNGATTQDLTNIAADTFSVVVTSSVGCSTMGTIIVPNVNDTIKIDANLVDNFSCSSPTGNIALNVTPLDTSYVYLWSSGQTVDSLSNLTAGTYMVTVTLGATCIAADTFVVADNATLPNLSSTSTAAICGLDNGSADLSVGAGVGPFTYLWSNAETTEDLSNLTPATYTVTVTGANSCTAVNTVNVLNNNTPLSVNGATTGNTSCATGNGSLDIGVSPAGAYNYLWSNAETTEDLNNLSPGTYTVTVSLGTCLSSNTFSVADNALSPNLAASGTAATCTQSDGAADLNVSGGNGPYQYLWSNAETTEDLSNLLPGTYTVTVTGANQCTSVSSVDVLNNNIAININGAPLENTSCTAANGSIDIGVTPAGAYNFAWSNSAVTEDVNNLSAGSYTVTVSFGSCTSTNTFLVTDNTATPNLVSNVTASVCSTNNGAIDLNVSGAVTPYTFIWSNSETTEDLANLLPGNFSVTVTAGNGCTITTTLNVPNNGSTFSLAGAAAPLTDCATNNGAIDLNITPAGSFTYLWSNAETTEDLSGLAPGTYTVSVTESGSCTGTASFFVIDQRTNPLTSQTLTPELCGLSDGSIDLSVSGGTAPYDYLWSGGQITEDLANIPAGTYTVVVTDANHCTASTSAVIPGNSINFALSGIAAPNSSCVQNDGSVDLTLNPPTGYTFLWSNAEVTEDLANVAAGTYTVTVSAGGNCTSTAAFVVASNVPTPALSEIIAAASCGQSSGNIDLSVAGSPGPYTYLWSNGATDEDLASVVSGSYSVVVTAANGCTTVEQYLIPENSFAPSIANTLTPTTSCVTNTGAIDLTVTPVMTYTFVWSNGSVTEDLSNLGAGTYTVTVSAGGACTSTAALTVPSDVPPPSIADNIAAATCGQASGSVDLNITGSPGPYNFNWSNASTNEDLSSVVSGSYTVTVTAANGCTAVESFTVPENTIVPNIASSLTASTSCVVNNGAIDLTITPATGYTFIWSNGSVTEDLSNIAAGSYTVTVNGGGACTNTASFNVSSNVPAPVLANAATAATCGQASGSIDLSVSGSPSPYNYNWSNASTNEDLNAIVSGSYTVTVTAANGCTTVGSFTVQENTIIPNIASSLTPANSCLTDNGAIDLSVTPAAGYTFLWSNGSVTEDLTNLAAGSYTVTVNGGGACTNTANFSVADQTTQPQANITSNTTALDCSITSITLNGNVSGTPNPTSIAWSSNGNPLGTGNTLAVTTPGQYILAVVDDVTSCTATATITISQNLNPPALSVATPALLTCSSPSQTLSGSSTVGGVQFAWATIVGTDTTILGSGSTIPVNAVGTYFLIGLNPANNCANAVSVNVLADQTPPVADAGQPFTLDCAGETLPLSGSGSGAANLSYLWTSQDGNIVSGANTTNPLIDKAGTYVLTVTNPANGCTETDEVVIVPEIPVAYSSVIQPTCLEELGAILVDSVTGLSNPILYSLNNSQPGSQSQFTNLVPGVYNLSVQGGNGCSASAVLTVNAPTLLEITLTPEVEIALGNQYLIDAQVNIPNADIASVTWTPPTGLECDTCLSTTAMPLGSTEYDLLVVSKAGCEARSTLILTVDKTRKVFGPNIFSPNEDGSNDFFTIFGDPVSVTRVKSLQVYSRWGEMVYERLDFAPTDTNFGWDGTFKGQKLNPAVFVWSAVVEFIDGQEELFTGDVMLKR